MNETSIFKQPAVIAPIAAQPVDLPAPARIEWLDSAKGVGIILVVIGHALGGLIDASARQDTHALRNMFYCIYLFHMPLFFLLSGLLVAQRIDKDPLKYIKSLLTTLLWPYFLWSIIQFSIIFQMNKFVNQPLENYWPTIINLPFHPVSQFWFLFVLFSLHVFSLFALRRLGSVTFLLICLVLKPLSLLIILPQTVHLVANQAAYYGIGVFLAVPGLRNVIIDRSIAARLLFIPLIGVVLIVAALHAAPTYDALIKIETAKAAEIANLAWHYQNLPAALAGAFTAIGLASLAHGSIAQLLRYLGQRTMPIFIFHILALAGMRIVLIKFGHIQSLYFILITTVIFGLFIPTALDWIIKKYNCSKLLGLG